MLTSLFTGISGLNANGLALSVIGDNIANANTVGFKASRTIFGDILSQTISGTSAMQVGRGVMVIDIQKMFTQGTLETTANPLDLAIEGDGFFVVRQINGPIYYTRAGQFRIDKEGYVIDPNGYRLQAYQMAPDGSVTGAIGDVYLAGLMSDPRATDEVKIQVNLDSRLSPPSQSWNFTTGPNLPDPNTYNFSTAITVYDSLGNPHLVYTYFVKDTTVGQWTAHIIYNTSPDPNNPNYTEAGTFTLIFDEYGTLTTPPTSQFDFDFSAWGAAAQSITFNFADSTQYGSPNAVVFQTQNGYSAGNLIAITVDQDGVISGVFTNGQVKKVAQVVLAKFVAPHYLTKVGKNLFIESYSSGGPTYGAPGTVGVGKVFANSLESSNVDLAEEFIRMIAAQRAYQANVRVITTTDNILDELMNIIR
ncbi:MAG: flagellar hook protein FlgE [Thermodesulfovibrionaceae bacterium]